MIIIKNDSDDNSDNDDKITHWGQVTHICVGYLTSIGSDNGLSPGRHQAIIWINAGILLIGSIGINFSEILIEIKTFSFKKMRLKVSSAKRRPFCPGLNVIMMKMIISSYLSLCIQNCVRCNWLWYFGNTAIQSAVDSPHKRPLILPLDIFFVVTLNKL